MSAGKAKPRKAVDLSEKARVAVDTNVLVAIVLGVPASSLAESAPWNVCLPPPDTTDAN